VPELPLLWVHVVLVLHEQQRDDVDDARAARRARRAAPREGFQDLGSESCCRRASALGASADAPLLRLPLVLSCSAVARPKPEQRVHQRRRTARVTTSARRARAPRDAPLVGSSRSCLSRGAGPIAPASAPTWVNRDAQTLLRWHRELVRRKWTRPQGRPGPSGSRGSGATARSALRARESTVGLPTDCGELLSVGMRVSPSTVRRLLLTAGLKPSPRRTGPS
jgi:hypothetical protein